MNEVYDEITRNTSELRDIIKEKYFNKVVKFESLVEEIKNFDKTVFLSKGFVNAMNLTPEQ